ncbi:MAG: aminopeptidase P family protein [Planctomycetaceae bacterium]|nr:aminopeptidase P family protein [Planctomycetaceae bacterium]
MSNYLSRREKIRGTLEQNKIDSFLVTNPVNVRYLSGFTGGDSFLLILPNDRDILLSDGRFTIQIEEECPNLEKYIRSSGEVIHHSTAKIIEKFNLKHCGVEADSMTLSCQFDILKELEMLKNNCCLVPQSGIVEGFRTIKDKSEIATIRKAIDVAAQGFFFIAGLLKNRRTAGWNEIDVRNELEYRMRLAGADEKSFPTIVGAGARAALPHGHPSRTQIEGQSHLLIDWGAIVNGYVSDLTRVFIFESKNKGKGKKLKTIYETVLGAQHAAIDAIKPGKTTVEIDAVARSIIRDAGFGKNFNHNLGHSFGLKIHENPRFSPSQSTVLKVGMVMTVEPGIYIQDWGGVRIEDDILITKDGCEILSKDVPKAFDEMCV